MISIHHGNKNSSTMPLYDEFLKTLPPDDGTSPSLMSKVFCGKTTPTSPGSSIHARSSDDRVEEFEGDSLTPEKRQSFLDKIYEPVDPSKVYGFDYDKMSLKMLLLNERNQDSFKLLGVVGMVGVGKTTLSRSILEEDEVKQRFVPRIQITMSEEPKSMEGAVKRMLEHLGIEEDIIEYISINHELPGLLYALHLKLKGKRYLIVLDDIVRDEDGNYEKLTSCLRDGHGFPKWNGAAIIVTSRHEEAIKTMVGEQNLHRLLPLSDPESCWQIYWNVASVDEVHDEAKDSKTSNTPKEVQEELKKKCGGLPLAARIMGELKHREMEREKAKELLTRSKTGSSQPSTPIDATKVSGDGSKEATDSKDGSSQPSTLIDATKVSGDGSKEATDSKDGSSQPSTPKDAPKDSADDSKEAIESDSKDGSKPEASLASGDDFNEAKTEDGPNQASM